MRLQSAILACLAAAQSVTAAPLVEERGASQPSSPTDFTISQVKNQRYQKRSGLVAVLRAYAKYNVTLTPRIEAAMKANVAAGQLIVKTGLLALHEFDMGTWD